MGRHRLRVLEAILLMVLARLLVAWVPFRLWRGTLGRPGAEPGSDARAAAPPPDRATLACVHALQRSAVRMAGTLCLPRAIALQWMLRRRRLRSTLVLGVLPQQRRGGLGDLHAWVEQDGLAILDEGAWTHRTILRLDSSLT